LRNAKRIVSAAVLFLATAAQAGITPISTSGYTTDVVVENSGSPVNGAANVGSDIFLGGYAFFQNGSYAIANPFNAAGVAIPSGSGLLTSRSYAVQGTNEIIRAKLAPYNGNNAIHLSAASPTGTLTLDPANQTGYSRIWLLANSDSGASTATVNLNYSDSTSDTVTSGAIPDWFGAAVAPTAQFATTAQRVNNLSSTTANPGFGSGPRLFAIPIVVPNSGKTLTSVTLTRDAASAGLPMVFGLAGDTSSGNQVISGGSPSVGVQLQGSTFVPATVGTAANTNNYPAAESGPLTTDNQVGTKYLNFAKTNTGVLITPVLAPGQTTVVNGISLVTANDAPERDPASFQIYGTNVPGSTNLADYTLIKDSGAITLPDDRAAFADFSFANSTPYSGFAVIFPTVKNAGSANSMQIGEIQLIGSVPEPTALGAIGAGIALLGLKRRRRA